VNREETNMKNYCESEETIDCQDYCWLIHRLLDDRNRLEQLVIDTREEVNALVAPGADPVYDMTAENVSDRSYCAMPAFKSYCNYFGEDALDSPW